MTHIVMVQCSDSTGLYTAVLRTVGWCWTTQYSAVNHITPHHSLTVGLLGHAPLHHLTRKPVHVKSTLNSRSHRCIMTYTSTAN
jgi:hypothetical protein